MGIQERLEALGIEIPEPQAPLASYVPGLRCGNMVYVSGQLPTEYGKLKYEGALGRDVDIQTGYAAARLAAVNLIGVLKYLMVDLEKVEQIVKITGYVQSADGFASQPQVINGASDLLEEVFGAKGKHARVAVGVNSLPLNAPCEIELIAMVAD